MKFKSLIPISKTGHGVTISSKQLLDLIEEARKKKLDTSKITIEDFAKILRITTKNKI